MANKRQMKKAINNACVEMANECLFAQSTFDNTNPEEWEKVIDDIAMLQDQALKRVSVDFDKLPKDFAYVKDYRKARRTYFHAVEKAIGKFMHEGGEKIVGEMNALVKK